MSWWTLDRTCVKLNSWNCTGKSKSFPMSFIKSNVNQTSAHSTTLSKKSNNSKSKWMRKNTNIYNLGSMDKTLTKFHAFLWFFTCFAPLFVLGAVQLFTSSILCLRELTISQSGLITQGSIFSLPDAYSQHCIMGCTAISMWPTFTWPLSCWLELHFSFSVWLNGSENLSNLSLNQFVTEVLHSS